MSSSNIIVRIVSSIWRGLDGARKVLHLLLLLVLFLVFFGAFSGRPALIPQRAALVIQPVGTLVDQLDGDAYDRALAELLGEAVAQTLVQDVVDAFEFAKNDDRITAVHLDLSGLGGGGLSKLRTIARAIEDFRASGKPVIATADIYSQAAYHLAAHSDNVYMHPEGLVFVRGYGGYRTYYKDAIDKLRLDWNVFRVGTHKSFVEPYTRMDMSPEDRESRTRLIDQFWAMYLHDVETARGLTSGTVDEFVQNMVAHASAAGGDIAIAAREAGLVDELLGRAEIREILKGYAGEDKHDSTLYASVKSGDYIRQMRLLHDDEVKDENVAIIVAAGEILDGSQPSGTIGGDSTALLLRRAL
ncbi:MAG TPA: S49 family peptidase, partial [Woeseiaceae bacterium]|nr:S49 family peptidase [Woeseiaceae bacterium]